jgi:iron complex outermembrane receptor protein
MAIPRHRFAALVSLVSLVLLVLAGLARPALAQPAGIRLSGVVRDASGAAVSGATITFTNQATKATQTATSSADGSYSVSLPPGVYTATATLKGLGQQTRRELKVDSGATPTADFALQTQLEEEVTVTALKRESTIQETPFSLAAPTEAVLRQRGVDDIEGVARNVAGLSVQNLGPGQSQVAIRGASSGQIARDQPGVKESVGAYLDESVISLSLFTPDLDLFDVSRVEVLRGPQGTLFGSGSESGTVRYISNQPELGGKARVFGEVSGSTIDGGSQGGTAKLGVNAPLGEKAALRVAGYYNAFAGYIDSPGFTRTTSGAVRPDTSTRQTDVNTGDRAGVRAAIKIVPNDRLTITPRFIYQKVTTDGWNRIDIFNILANPYTTTRPPVTLGEREQFVQTPEPFSDKFSLGDLTLSYRFGGVTLTSITSYTHRDILVVRDATALTGSVTGGTIGLGENVYTLDAPLDDKTKAHTWTQELRFSGGQGRLQWVAGGFYGDTKRDYGQSLYVAGFTEISGIPSQGTHGAGNDVLFFSDLHYKYHQFALFGEATYQLNDRVSLVGGLRYYNFNEDRTQVFDGLFADPGGGPASTDADGVAPRLILTYKASDTTNLNAQVSKGFRLGGINDPLNVPLCTPADLQTFGGHEAWDDETAWNYEIGSKSRLMAGRGSLNLSAFYMDVKDLQATVTAGSCSSRVVFNVPKARSVGGEVELSLAPNDHFDFAVSAGFNNSEIRSTVTSTALDGTVSVVSGIETGARLPSVPEFQMSAAATYQWHLATSALGYATGTYQHVGSRYTQVGDQDLGTLDLLSFGANTIGAPLTQSTFHYDPLLPAYDVVNLRLGVVWNKWDFALYGNNLTDERALLALDRERGTRARIGFLTNQPRSFGLSARVAF